jgi:hypothetical protein
LASITIPLVSLDPVVDDDNFGWRVERLEQNIEALEQERDDGLLVEGRLGFAPFLRANARTLSGKGLNKGLRVRVASSRYSVRGLSDRMVKIR